MSLHPFDVLRIVNLALIATCFVLFAPAIRHARDNADRAYLLGGAVILAGLASGTIVRLGAPFNVGQAILPFGLALWIASAYLSRQRRRSRSTTRNGGGSG